MVPTVSYWYETLSLTLREEQRLRVPENRVLRRIFGPKRDEVTRVVLSGDVKNKMVQGEYFISCFALQCKSKGIPLHATKDELPANEFIHFM
jgi:hypothetical protein